MLSGLIAALGCSSADMVSLGDGDGDGDSDGDGDGDDVGPDAGSATPAADCFADAFANPTDLGPDYDQYGPIVGSHCNGTDHQTIDNVERVVFVGDSITVGSPPTEAGDFYRSELADTLAGHFGIDAPNGLWEQVNLVDGVGLVQTSGDFAHCAKWGARTDDLMADNSQLLDCFPVDERDRRTLVVITMGGNDIASITDDAIEGATGPELMAKTDEFVGLMREAVEWIKEPGRFPNGVFVVFANMYEFTDGTGDTAACPGAAAAGYGDPPDDVESLANAVIHANEQYMKIAVDTDSDLMFMLESFCGHGYKADDPSSPCYRGPDSENWFDLTCIHPNPTGHGKIADLFLSVIAE